MARKSFGRVPAIALAVTAALGCGDGVSPELGSFDASLQLWQDAGPADYRYTFQRLCFCIDIRAVEIEVRAGAIVSVTVIETNEQLAASEFSRFETVEGLFAVVRDAMERPAEVLEVTYHPTLGYPTQINVDYSLNIADEEQRILASGLVELQ